MPGTGVLGRNLSQLGNIAVVKKSMIPRIQIFFFIVTPLYYRLSACGRLSLYCKLLWLLRGERPVDGMKAPLPIRLDQHCCDDKGPFRPNTPHPIAQTVDSEMGGIRQAIIQ